MEKGAIAEAALSAAQAFEVAAEVAAVNDSVLADMIDLLLVRMRTFDCGGEIPSPSSDRESAFPSIEKSPEDLPDPPICAIVVLNTPKNMLRSCL
jgi:hypothetical protein